MLQQIKQKLLHSWKQKVQILDVNYSPNESTSNNDTSPALSAALLLPRGCYFETVKTYPLSVGSDINKITAIDAKQISPYGASTWVKPLIIKQQERFVVYYFALLPKYQTTLETYFPLFILPETAEPLMNLQKGSDNEVVAELTHLTFAKNEDGIWLSSLDKSALATANGQVSLKPKLSNLSALSRFYNPQVIDKLKNSVSRIQQIKILASLSLLFGVFILLSNLYLTGIDWYLNDKREQARPVISDLFKAKDSLRQLQSEQDEVAKVYQSGTEYAGALMLIASLQQEFALDVKDIRTDGNVILLNAKANNANALLAKILQSDKVNAAEFKRDVKTVSGGLEQFELTFNWEQKLWQTQ